MNSFLAHTVPICVNLADLSSSLSSRETGPGSGEREEGKEREAGGPNPEKGQLASRSHYAISADLKKNRQEI